MKKRLSPARSQGFTLVEMLTVLAIMAILILLVAPSLKGVMRAYQLTVTGQTVIGQLNLARQTALAGNHAVRVYFYYLPDYNQPAATGTPAVFRGMQCFQESDLASDGSQAVPTLTAQTKPIFFTAPVQGSVNQNSSTMLYPAPIPPTGTTDAQPPALPGYGLNFKYTMFRFKSGGGTNLTTTNNCITFMLENDTIKDTTNGLPANYLTITVDPVTGTLQLYRP